MINNSVRVNKSIDIVNPINNLANDCKLIKRSMLSDENNENLDVVIKR
jgi:hypothetical protein